MDTEAVKEIADREKKMHEPRFHVVKRASYPWYKSWAIHIIAIALALVFCGLLTMLLTGLSPIEVYTTMWKGSFGTTRRIWNLLQETAMLLCISVALVPAFTMRFWNIGAEGQVLMGGLATAAAMILLGDTNIPNAVLIIIMIVVSIAAGAIWAIIPAVFKAKWNTNETLFTLMMNYVAIQLCSYFSIVWEMPKGSGTIGIINQSTRLGWLPTIGDYTYLLNIIVVVVLTIVIFLYMKYTKHGYEIAVVGQSENTARYVGINIKKVIIRTMALSGAICGIAGLLLVGGTDHTITSSTANNRGFTAIMIAWLGKLNPILMIIVSLLIAFLEKGAGQITSDCGLNDSFSDILTGIILFFIIGCEFFANYQIKMRKSGKEDK